MVREGLRNVAAGANPMSLKRGIEQAVEVAVASIADNAHDVSDDKEQIANVAAISSADPEIGSTIADAIDSVGKDGVITVEEGQTFGLDLDFVEGMALRQGLYLPLQRHRHRAHGSRARQPLHPACRLEDLRCA